MSPHSFLKISMNPISFDISNNDKIPFLNRWILLAHWINIRFYDDVFENQLKINMFDRLLLNC